MPTVPALGGKLNSTTAILRSARALRRSATMRATRLGQHGGAFRMHHHVARRLSSPAAPERPPNVIGQMPPSSSGIATIIVASTGSSPRGSAFHCSSVWNSTGCAEIYGTSSAASSSSAARGVIVGGAADEAEPGQRHDRIDRRLAVADEILLHRLALVEAAGEGRDHRAGPWPPARRSRRHNARRCWTARRSAAAARRRGRSCRPRAGRAGARRSGRARAGDTARPPGYSIGAATFSAPCSSLRAPAA